MITVENIAYQYAESEDMALQDVSFTIEKGEWVAIVGHNGSGKSTTAKLLNGLLTAKSGHIIVNGITLTEETVWDVRSQMGMVFQNPDNQFVGATVQDDVAFGLENQGVPFEEMTRRVQEALEQVGMWAFKDKEPARLSGGQKQRVAIASVLALRPNVIILDEATAMLDPKGRRDIIAVMKRLKETLGLTVLSITHDVEEAQLADKMIVLEKGRVVAIDKPSVLFSQVEYMTKLGLEVPLSQRILQQLQQRGIQAPQAYMNQEELEEWLCQLLLNK